MNSKCVNVPLKIGAQMFMDVFDDVSHTEVEPFTFYLFLLMLPVDG